MGIMEQYRSCGTKPGIVILIFVEKTHDPFALALLRTIPGVGEILSLVILYEIEDIRRFPEVGNFISYCRLVKCAHESAGKRVTGGNNKIGNTHLKWAFSEASVLFLRKNEPAQKMHNKLVKKYGKAKALSIIAQKLARAAFDRPPQMNSDSESRFFIRMERNVINSELTSPERDSGNLFFQVLLDSVDLICVG